MKLQIALILLSLDVCVTEWFANHDQSIKVVGNLTCEKEPIAGLKIKLFDLNTIEPNDLLATTYTNKYGYFEMEAVTGEIRKIEPYLKIEHNCGLASKDTNQKCFKIRYYKVQGEALQYDILEFVYQFFNVAINGTAKQNNNFDLMEQAAIEKDVCVPIIPN